MTVLPTCRSGRSDRARRSSSTPIITNGLTGIEHDTVGGKEFHYTKESTVTVDIAAEVSPGTIVSKTVQLSDGRTFDATSGPVDVTGLVEGTYELTALVVAENDGLRTSRSSDEEHLVRQGDNKGHTQID